MNPQKGPLENKTGFKPQNKMTFLFPPRLTFQTILLFVVFFVSNTLLSYSDIGLVPKIAIGVVGLMIPLLLTLGLSGFHGAGNKKGAGERDSHEKEVLGIPKWALVTLVAASLFARFYRLESLSVWPMWDDALNAFYSIRQMGDWHWALSYTPVSATPFFFWSEALFFLITGPSLTALWVFPALWSVLTLGVGWWAARQYFSRLDAFLFFLVLGFSFWPLYLWRFNLSELGPLWELLLLGFFARFRANRSRVSVGLAFFLGLGVGSGFYISLMALVGAVPLSGAVLWECWTRKPKAWLPFICYLLPVLVLFLPMAPYFYENIFQGHIHMNLLKTNGIPRDPLAQGEVSLSYLTALLWGTPAKYGFDFGPFWGGFFNPILGSFLLLGALEVWWLKGKKIFFWMLGLFLFLMLPGILSCSVEIMRIVLILPFCCALVAVGWRAFVQAFAPHERVWVLGLTLLSSASLDAYHLLGPYHLWAVPGSQSGPYKSPERFRAFNDLQPKVRQEGPGFLLTELVPDTYDQSLVPACYPFNAALNPRLAPRQAHWTALFTYARYQNYISIRFPTCEIFPLSDGLPRADGPMVLVWIPQTPLSDPLLHRWLLADQSLNDIYLLMPYDSGKPNSFGPMLQALEKTRPFFRGDPFLESCYWDKMAYIEELDNQTMNLARASALQGVKVCSAEPSLALQGGHFWQKLANEDEYYFLDNARAVEDLRHVIHEKYHLAQAYGQLSGLLNRIGKKKDAEAAARKAAAYESQGGF